jgi:hypothetical protein
MKLSPQSLDAARKRAAGMSPEKLADLEIWKESQTNWTATCRVCGAELKGTLAEIRAHKHVS